MGVNNINLTMEYVQEEDPTHKFEEKKKITNSFLLVLNIIIPGQKLSKHWSEQNRRTISLTSGI